MRCFYAAPHLTVAPHLNSSFARRGIAAKSVYINRKVARCGCVHVASRPRRPTVGPMKGGVQQCACVMHMAFCIALLRRFFLRVYILTAFAATLGPQALEHAMRVGIRPKQCLAPAHALAHTEKEFKNAGRCGVFTMSHTHLCQGARDS